MTAVADPGARASYRRLSAAAMPSVVFGASLGIGKIVRDCSLTCNVGYQAVPLALLSIAALTAPFALLALRLERRLGPWTWQAALSVVGAASLLGFRLLILQLQRPAALRWSYLSFYVWVGILAALLGASAFATLLLRLPAEEQERGLIWGAVGFASGGLLGSLLARSSAVWMTRAFAWPYPVVRDNLLLPMALLLLVQAGLSARGGPPQTGAARARAVRAGGWADLHGLVREPIARLAAVLVLAGGASDTLLKYLFYWVISEQTPAAGGRTLLFADFYLWVNGANLFVLALGSSRLIRRVGLAMALATLPLALAFGTAALAFQSAVVIVYAVRVVESSLHAALYDPSLDRLFRGLRGDAIEPVRGLLKGAVPRLGEGGGALLVIAARHLLGAGLPGLLAVFAGLIAAWLAGIGTLGRLLRRSAGAEPHRLA